MMKLCVTTCSISDDLEKLGQGQTGLESFQFVLSVKGKC